MQALIDFDGWRKWKDFSSSQQGKEDEKKTTAKKKKGNRISVGSNAAASSSQVRLTIREEGEGEGVDGGVSGGAG